MGRMKPRALLLLLAALPIAAAEPDPARLPRKPLYEPPWVEGQIVLIGYKDAPKPVPGATRSKEEALTLARKVVEEARAKGARFDQLVMTYSEDPFKKESLGKLGSLPRGAFPVPAVEEALYAMGEGQVSDPIESPSGYVVAMRLAFQTCASHIVVAWAGCQGAPTSVARNKTEALQRAQELRKRIVGAEDFAKVARECSDDPSSAYAGHLGFIKRGTMTDAFDSVVFALAPGELSEPAETEYGYHLILARTFADCSHILVAFKEAATPIPGAVLTRAEALTKAEQVLARIKAGEPFPKLAIEASDDPVSSRQGGHMGPHEPGQYVKEFEEVLYKLRPGEISGIVETPFGLHIILRWR